MRPNFNRLLVGLLVGVGALNAGPAPIFGGPALAFERQISPAELNLLKESFARPRSLTPTDGIPFPAAAPYSPERAELGRKLFFDPVLSADGSVSCASCHDPGHGWEAPAALMSGVSGKRLGRHTPTLLGVAWSERLLWDGSKNSLEEQALGPLTDPDEMGASMDALAARLSADARYAGAFAEAFGDGVTPENIVQALATFERTILPPAAPFDRWIEGDDSAIPAAAKRGFVLFNTKARCAACHAGWLFTDRRFHDTGIATGDIGRALVETDNPKRLHAFKTPTLREISARAPYMHNGSLPSLDAVLDHYLSGGAKRPSKSALIEPVELSAGERADLLAFLKTLGNAGD